MKATDITKSWENLRGFIMGRVTGTNKDNYPEGSWEMIDSNGSKLMKDVDLEEINTLSKKIMELNILSKNVSFKDFENMPAIWSIICGNAVDSVASELGQMIRVVED